MLIEESHKDVRTQADGEGEMRMWIPLPKKNQRNPRKFYDAIMTVLNVTGVFLFHPKISNYPHARFPGVVLFSEIYQGIYIHFLLDRAFSSPWNGTTNPLGKDEVQLPFGLITLS